MFDYKKGQGDTVGGFLSGVCGRMTTKPRKSRKQASGAGNQESQQEPSHPALGNRSGLV